MGARGLVGWIVGCCFVAACAAPARKDVVYPSVMLDGITVTANAKGNVGWTVAVTNYRSETISVVWDESSYVNTAGQTLGRLIRGNTRVMHTDQPQPPSPIAPGSTLEEWCVPEQHVQAVGTMRSPGVSATGSGRIIIVFQTAQGRETWEGTVVFDGSGQPAAPTSIQGPPGGTDTVTGEDGDTGSAIPETLDRDAIAKTIKAARDGVEACGVQFPDAKGEVKLAIKVATDGAVEVVDIVSAPVSTGGGDLAACVADLARGLMFPSTTRGGSFKYPFTF